MGRYFLDIQYFKLTQFLYIILYIIIQLLMLLFLNTFFSILPLSYKPVDYLRLKVFPGLLKRLAMFIKLVTFLQGQK